MKLCMKMGEEDTSRRQSNNHKVMHFGIKMQFESNETVPAVYGSKYFSEMTAEDELQLHVSIGLIMDFIWNVLQNIQSNNKKPHMGSN